CLDVDAVVDWRGGGHRVILSCGRGDRRPLIRGDPPFALARSLTERCPSRSRGYVLARGWNRANWSRLGRYPACGSGERPNVTAARTASGRDRSRFASGAAPSASLTVEKAMRSPTYVLIARIWASSNPATRSARTSSSATAFGSVARSLAHRASA